MSGLSRAFPGLSDPKLACYARAEEGVRRKVSDRKSKREAKLMASAREDLGEGEMPGDRQKPCQLR